MTEQPVNESAQGDREREAVEEKVGETPSASPASEDGSASQEGEGLDREAVAQLEAAHAAMKDRALRVAADFENYKKRVQAEREELFKFANEEFIVALLPVLDGFDRAMAQSKEVHDAPTMIKGFALIKRQLEDILTKMGVKKIESVGKLFDPNIHEAAMTENQPERPDQTVLEELQTGYQLHGRVIRAAMVTVNQHAA